MTKQFRTLPSSVLYDEKITGYTATGMTYDMDAQNKIAERYSIEAYQKISVTGLMSILMVPVNANRAQNQFC